MASQDDSQNSQDSTMTIMQENRHEVLYFAYGSNLSTEQMRQRCPYSTPVGLAYLRGWRWQINQRGFANVVQTEDDNDNDNDHDHDQQQQGVYGLLYLLPPQDEEVLDNYEGVPFAYQKYKVDVEWANASPEAGILRALVYIDTERTEEDVPREEYVERMERGIQDAVENWGMDEGWADVVMRRFWRRKGKGKGRA